VQNTGLLDELAKAFTEKTQIEVLPVAAGSGRVMEMGRRGDLDILIVHSPKAEDQFVADGFGVKRHSFMKNDFVIAGPKSDPAECYKAKSVQEALQKIVDSNCTWVSRGDESGTYVREKQLWADSAIQTSGWAEKHSLKTGQGMGATLRIAAEKDGYTLTDRATLVLLQSTCDLQVCFAGEDVLRNVYSVIVVDSEKHSHVNTDAANAFVRFINTRETRQLIAQFGRERNRLSLFTPLD
jgi:tungstate transport system substrate-binding protein